MDPITGMAVIGSATAAASALGQYLNSRQARAQAGEQYARLQKIYEDMKSPDFDMSKLSPEDFKVVGQYVPEAAGYIAEQAPDLVKQSAAGDEGQQAQLQALRGLRNAASGRDIGFEGAMNTAGQQAAQQAHSMNETTLQDANRRGMLDSGLQFASQLNNNASAAAQAGDRDQQAAMESYRNKLQMMQQAGALGGQVQSNDLALQAQNTGITNAFKQRQRQQQQAYGEYTAGLKNDAQRYNLGVAQQTANANTQQHNDYAKYNQQYLNGLRQQGFTNQYNIASGRAGQAQQSINNMMAGARDTNAAIQGVSNAGMAGLQYYGAEQDRSANRDLAQQQLDAQKQYLQYLQTRGTQPMAPTNSAYQPSYPNQNGSYTYYAGDDQTGGYTG